MISHKHRCIFIHIPRTAGTNIERAIKKVNVLQKHLTIKRAIEIYGDKWNTYFTFTIIRNPWDRMISHYFQHFYNVENVGHIHTKEDLIRFLKNESKKVYLFNNNKGNNWEFNSLNLKKVCRKIIGFNKGKGLKYFLDRYKPAPWEPDPLTLKNVLEVPEGYKPIDFIGRFENINDDFKKICKELNIERKLPYVRQHVHQDVKRTKHYTEYYDDETKQIVYERYKWDIETFGYKFNIETKVN